MNISKWSWKLSLKPVGKKPMPASDAKRLADMFETRRIYWSDDRCAHWMFDFRCGDWWVSVSDIDMCERTATCHCYYEPGGGLNMSQDLLEAIVGI